MPGRSGKLYRNTVTQKITFEIEESVAGNTTFVAFEGYRYGFNGIENDAEWGIYAAEYRFFDSRLGRWLSPDPIFHAHMSPYVGMDDNPVALCDPYGLATGKTPAPVKIRKGGKAAAERRVREIKAKDTNNKSGARVTKSKIYSGRYNVDYVDENGSNVQETYEETKVQKVLSWIGDKVETAYEWLGEKESTVKSIFRDKANRFAESKTGKGIKTVAHEGFLPVAKGVNNVSQMLLPTKSAMNLISGAATGKNLEGEEMTKGDYAWETLGVLPIGMADDAARGAKGLIDEVGENAGKMQKLLLNRFNTVESLIESAGKLERVKHGARLGEITGNADDIFRMLADSYGAVIHQTNKGISYFKAGAVSVHLYPSTTTELPTLAINIADKLFKIRLKP